MAKAITIPHLPADKLAAKVQPEFVMLAARDTCKLCNGLGAYVAPVYSRTVRGAKKAAAPGTAKILRDSLRSTKVCGCAFRRFAKRNATGIAFHADTKELHWIKPAEKPAEEVAA